MARPLTAAMAQAMRDHRTLALLAEIEHPDGTARFWTGIGSLEWGGHTWTGAGTLGNVTPIRHTSDLTIQEINFQMVGADPAVVATLSDNVRNLAGRVWLACLDDAGKVVRDPYQIVDATLDYQSFTASEDGTAVVQITARTGFYSLERAIDEAWTTEEHKLLYPDDSGLDLIPSLVNKTLEWTPS